VGFLLVVIEKVIEIAMVGRTARQLKENIEKPFVLVIVINFF